MLPLLLSTALSWQATRTTPAINPEVQQVEFQQAPIQEALKSVFEKARVPFSIRPEVKGAVTVSLRRVRLSMAVRNLVYQVDGLSELRNGVWTVFLKEATPSKQTVDLFDFVDMDADVAVRRVFDATKLRFVWLDPPKGRVNVAFPPTLPLESALRGVLDRIGYDYQVVKGTYYLQKAPVMEVHQPPQLRAGG